MHSVSFSSIKRWSPKSNESINVSYQSTIILSSVSVFSKSVRSIRSSFCICFVTWTFFSCFEQIFFCLSKIGLVVVPTAEILINFLTQLLWGAKYNMYYISYWSGSRAAYSTLSSYYLHSTSKSSVLDSRSTIKDSNFQIILAHHEVFGIMSVVQRPEPAQLCLHLKNKTVALRVKRSINEGC